MKLRKYQSSDCPQIVELFYATVYDVNAKDYTKEQLEVWSTGNIDLIAWNQSFLNNYTVVVVEGEKVLGFGDIETTGYLNRLYVHKDYQNQGIATVICNELEQQVSGMLITTHASITAKPFFEKRGYVVVKEQEVERQGIMLKNYIMKKTYL